MKVVQLPRPMRLFVKQQNSPNTQDAYRRDLERWVEWQVGKPFTVETVIAYRAYLIERYAPASAKRIFSTARTFYDWMRKQGKLAINPFEVVKVPKQDDVAVKVPTDVHVERILKTVDRWDGWRGGRGARDYAILTLLLNGLRAQEVCNLRWCDYFYSGAWVVRVIGKGQKERFVPVNRETQEALEYYMDCTFKPGVTQRGEREQPLFKDILGQPMTRKQIAYLCDRYGQAAGVRGFSPHSFRHHYGTRLYRATRDILGVGKLMGHSRPETTKQYARLDLTDLIETARLDPRNPSIDKTEYDDAIGKTG